jgi:hypothetical protein
MGFGQSLAHGVELTVLHALRCALHRTLELLGGLEAAAARVLVGLERGGER